MMQDLDRGVASKTHLPRTQAALQIVKPLTLALLLSTTATQVFAQSATPGATMTLAPINVEDTQGAPAQGASSQGVPAQGASTSTAALRERLNALPGGVALITAEEMPSTANLTLSRSLSMVPGVVVQDFFGGNDQPRVQIRGSGLQQNPVERGILVLQNGLPINRADGSYIVGFANPRQADSIEVYRGYMANRLGATVLGGAINFASPTGSNSPGVKAEISGGSYGQFNLFGQAGGRKDNVDALIQADISQRDGFRDYNESRRINVNANVGVELSDNVTTRFFAGYTDLGFDVAGPLPKEIMYANPRQVWAGPVPVGGVPTMPGPNVIRDKPRREADQLLLGSRTTATFGAHIFDLALGYTYTDDMFRFPISSGVRTTKGGDFTGLVRYAYKPNEAALLPLFESTAQYTVGSADRGYYINQGGQTGAMFGANDLDASTLSLYSGLNVPVWQAFYVSPSIAYSHATRDSKDLFNGQRPWFSYAAAPSGFASPQNTSYSRTYEGWTPSLALSYRPDKNQTVFAAVSRSFEPPTHDDLIATVNSTPNSSPGRYCDPTTTPPTPPTCLKIGQAFSTPDLKAQTATTVEGGWRGRFANFSWDAVTYYSWIENELLSLRDSSGAPLGAVNADKTSHFGIELGVGVNLTQQLSARVAYTYQDFRFRNDVSFGNNRLAGAPRHLINTVVQYQATDAWKLQGAVRWSPDKTPVDNANTLFADPYAVVDLRTEYKIDRHFTLFAEITNLFDKTYAGSTLIVDRVQRPDQAVFLPADGRGYYGGIKATF